jgi:hypothetical protein
VYPLFPQLAPIRRDSENYCEKEELDRLGLAPNGVAARHRRQYFASQARQGIIRAPWIFATPLHPACPIWLPC